MMRPRRIDARQLFAWLALAVTLALLLSYSVEAWARPGGGHSYSGGTSHSSRSSGSRSGGGGDGDGAGLIFQLILLCIRYPALGVPVLIILVVFFVAKAAIGAGQKGWSTSTPESVQAVQRVEQSAGSTRAELDSIRALDPGFSLVLFEDFAYLLYAAVQRARATGSQALAAYLAPNLAQSLLDPQLSDVQGIVIGAMRYVRFSGTRGPMLELELELESNYVEVLRAGGTRRFYAVDRLVLTRAATARSRPPARAHTLDCPNCGAPLEAIRGTECNYCRQNVGFGRFDWMIAGFSNRTRETRGPLLTSDVAESGTELSTIVDRSAAQRFEELVRKDPALGWQPLQSRVALIFAELQAAWSGRDALRIRPFVSDNLFQSMYYWIDLYTSERCRNVTENATILRIDLANVLSDAYFDAITLRIFASSIDYTISDDGKLLSGHRSRPRTYSEYWTLIRGTSRRGEPRRDNSCPNCGAPLRISMTGQCEYCRVKVTSGDFDWVLSRIEQDESYGG
ncbi:MAG TPA: TIM44-like domain-containing protein [Polyangiaceae bacterium]|nr:TIM44-like domain-containing protein [Polyangiaceae bacterium]